MINVGGKGSKYTNEQLALKANQTDLTTINTNVTANTNAISLKADKTYVDAQVASVASGSPKGTYATLTDLQTAHPTGNANIYLVVADGKWYYWNGSAWTAGGVYQTSVGLTTIVNAKDNSKTPTWIGSYDSFFSVATPDVNTLYALEATDAEAFTRYSKQLQPTLLIKGGKGYPIDGDIVRDGLAFWVDAKYKSNGDTNKAVFNDISVNRKNGALAGFLYDSTSGWSSNGLVFAGTNERATFSSMVFNSTGFTIEAVYYHPEAGFPADVRLVNCNTDYISLYTSTNSQWNFKFFGNTRPTIPFALINKNQLNHIAISVDETARKIKVFLNGVLVSNVDMNATNTYSSITTFYIGSKDTVFPMKGKVSSVRLHNRPLLDTEITQNYAFEAVRINPAPIDVINGEVDTLKSRVDTIVTDQSKLIKYSDTDWTTIPTPSFVSHRGCEVSAPENTMAAFNLSAQHGFPIGTDMYETRDGILVCRHDDDLSTRSTARGKVSQSLYSSFFNDSAGLWMGESFRYEKIPTFEQILDKFGGKHLLQPQIYSVQSDATYAKIADMIAERELEKYVVFEVNTTGDMNKLLNVNPNILVAITGNQPSLPLSDSYNLAFMVNWSSGTITQAGIDAAKAKGLKVQVWGADTKARSDELIGMGVDFINCADPIYFAGKANLTNPFTIPVGADSYGAGWILSSSPNKPDVKDHLVGFTNRTNPSNYESVFDGYTTKIDDIIQFALNFSKITGRIYLFLTHATNGSTRVFFSPNGTIDFQTKDAAGNVINSGQQVGTFTAYTVGEEKTFSIKFKSDRVSVTTPSTTVDFIYSYPHGKIGLGFEYGVQGGFRNIDVSNVPT